MSRRTTNLRKGDQGGESADLTGSMLIALPTLIDPNFRRTILFLVRHDTAEGAMGVILNRPTSSRLADLDAEVPESLDKVPVYEGGPVEQNQLILAKMIQVQDSTSFETIGRQDLQPHQGIPDGELRAFIGYAGWEAGQLEREIAEGSWIAVPPTPELLATPSTSEEGVGLWRSMMRRLGSWNHLMSGAPDDLSLN